MHARPILNRAPAGMLYQAETGLAAALIAAIPSIARQDVVTGTPCDQGHQACREAIVVTLSFDEAIALAGLVQRGQADLGGGICLVCGCPLANLRCGHTCCCSAGSVDAGTRPMGR